MRSCIGMRAGFETLELVMSPGSGLVLWVGSCSGVGSY